MLHISLFSGIGGFDLAAQWVGWTNVASCEIAEFPRKVLQHHFPDAYHHDDIKTLTYEKLDYELKKRFGSQWRSDDIVLSGGFPCQPYSIAGKRLGKEDDRHLWPEMLRCIREIQPKWVVGENVLGIVNWNGGLVFDEVQSDLEAEGYEVQAYVLPACAVNAPHRRDRVWFVAYSNDNRHTAKRGKIQETDRIQGKHWQKMGSGKFDGASANDGLTKNTNQDGRGSEFGQKESGERQFRNACAGNNEPISSNDGEIRLTPDPTSEGREERQQVGGWANSAKNRTGLVNGIERPFDDGFAPDPRSVGMSGQPTDPGTSKNTGQGRESVAQDGNTWSVRRWEGFPTTQPTIRRGDDGISRRLDGITFSKWRNESIKAYGNAVVPQVVYEIFKAVIEYERL